MSRLPVPFVEPDDPAFDRMAALVRTLLKGQTAVEEMEEYAELQAIVARLYGLNAEDFEHVLSTFPLVPEAVRVARLLSIQRLSLITSRGGAETRRFFSGRNTELTERIIGCALEVHRRLGPGLLENVYESALCIELKVNRLAFTRQVGIPLYYRGELIAEHRPDLDRRRPGHC